MKLIPIVNKGNGGKQPIQKDTIIPQSNPVVEHCGKLQSMKTDNGLAKGLRQTLEEWGFSTKCKPSVLLCLNVGTPHCQGQTPMHLSTKVSLWAQSNQDDTYACNRLECGSPIKSAHSCLPSLVLGMGKVSVPWGTKDDLHSCQSSSSWGTQFLSDWGDMLVH